MRRTGQGSLGAQPPIQQKFGLAIVKQTKIKVGEANLNYAPVVPVMQSLKHAKGFGARNAQGRSP